VIDGRVVPTSAYRAPSSFSFERSPRWTLSLAVVGLLALVASAFVAVHAGETLVLTGVGLFFLTAVLAAADRPDLAAGVGFGAILFVSIGIALLLGTIPPGPIAAAVAAGTGGALAIGGSVASRLVGTSPRPS
jgi:hypothetical protein